MEVETLRRGDTLDTVRNNRSFRPIGLNRPTKERNSGENETVDEWV